MCSLYLPTTKRHIIMFINLILTICFPICPHPKLGLVCHQVGRRVPSSFLSIHCRESSLETDIACYVIFNSNSTHFNNLVLGSQTKRRRHGVNYMKCIGDYGETNAVQYGVHWLSEIPA